MPAPDTPDNPRQPIRRMVKQAKDDGTQFRIATDQERRLDQPASLTTSMASIGIASMLSVSIGVASGSGR